MKKTITFCWAFIFTLSSASAKTIELNERSLQEIGMVALDYTLKDQIQDLNHPLYHQGEWTTQVKSTLLPIMAGVGLPFVKDEEATAFTTGSVINILGQLYLDFPEYHQNNVFKEIPKAIDLGTTSFRRYKNGESFNYYPPFILKSGQVVRRAVDLKVMPLWKGFINIPNDADTTSVAFSALLFDEKINHKQSIETNSVFKLLEKYRDVERRPHYYNARSKEHNTGAFMTWLHDENDPLMPHFIFASSKKGARIPLVKNDVDCIVNANVLRMKALAQKSHLAGEKEACHLINSIIQKDQEYRCGIYYPNTMNLSFVMALAQRAGDQCLTDNSKQLIVSKILSSQYVDGSWANEKNLWKDRVITTGFALYSLIEYRQKESLEVDEALKNGIKYLVSQVRYKKNQFFWPADHFFTATALVRSLIMWESRAYTNGLIASVFLKIHSLFPHMKVADYKKLNFESANLRPLPDEWEHP